MINYSQVYRSRDSRKLFTVQVIHKQINIYAGESNSFSMFYLDMLITECEPRGRRKETDNSAR